MSQKQPPTFYSSPLPQNPPNPAATVLGTGQNGTCINLSNPLRRVVVDSPFLLIFIASSLLSLIFTDSSLVALPPFLHCYHHPHLALKLLTHPLSHADAAHFFYNFKTIIMLHPSMERQHTSKYIFLLYLINAIICGVFHWVFGSKSSMLLGSSG